MTAAAPAAGFAEAGVARSLLLHLLRDFTPIVAIGGGLHRGISDRAGVAVAGALETALAAEALSQPLLAKQAPEIAEALFACLAAMSSGGVLARAVGALPMQLLSADPRALDLRTTTHQFHGDLHAGVLRQRLGGWAEKGLQHGGTMVEFQLAGRDHCIDVEDNVVEVRVEREPSRVRLHQVSEIAAPGRFGLRRRAVGLVTYTYEIAADTPWLDVEVAFEPRPGVVPQRLRLLTACDGLSDSRAYRSIRVEGREVAPVPGVMTLQAGPLQEVSVSQPGVGGQTLTLRPERPERVVNCKLTVREDQAAHWLLLRHDPGAALRVREQRLLLDGPAAPRQRGRDFARARGRGIALHAAARWLRQRRRDDGQPGAAQQAALETLCADLREAMRREEGLPALEVGFLVQAELLLDLPPAEEALLALEQRERLNEALEQGCYGTPADQAAAILGLVAMGAVEALGRALIALRLGSHPVETDGRSAMAELAILRVAEGEHRAADAFSLVLLVRALRATTRARACGRIVLSPEVAARAARLERQYADLLVARLRVEGEGLAVADSPLGGRTAGAGQAAALGFAAGL